MGVREGVHLILFPVTRTNTFKSYFGFLCAALMIHDGVYGVPESSSVNHP